MTTPGMYGRLGKVPRRTQSNRTVRSPTSVGQASPGTGLRKYSVNVENAVTTHDWLHPSAAAVGDMLLAAVCTAGYFIDTIPDGWTKFGDGSGTGGAGDQGRYLYWKLADGSEADTTFTTAGDASVEADFWYIPANGSTLTAPSVSSFEGTNTGDPDIDPSAVSVSTPGTYFVYIAALMNKGDPNGESAGYETFSAPVGGSLSARNWIMDATKELTTGEDPGVAGWVDTPGSRYYQVWTFAVLRGESAAAVLAGDTEHDDLPGRSNDDNHPHYSLVDGSRAFTGEQAGVTPTVDASLATKGYVDGAAGTDADAIHDNVDGEISLVTEKATPVSADLVLIEDSEAANAKKRVQVGNLPGGTSDHGALTGLADDDHTQYLLAAGTRAATFLEVSGLTGATGSSPRFVGGTTSGAPASGTFALGDYVVTEDGNIYVCTTAGSPGTWTSVGAAAATDAAAIHDDTANEISAITEKTTPADDDLFVIEDSAASFVKKKLKVSNLPSSGSGGGINHALHASYTLSPAADSTEGDSHTLGPDDSDWVADQLVTNGIRPNGQNGSFGREGCVSWGSGTPVIRVDLGSAKSITSVRMFGAGTGGGIVSPGAIKVEHSDDDSTWTADADLTALTGGSKDVWSASIDVSATARYWRVTLTRDDEWVSLGEMELWG